MPERLGFVKGAAGSEDLPLNVSCETLQQNKILLVIEKNSVEKSIEMFDDPTENEDAYLSQPRQDRQAPAAQLRQVGTAPRPASRGRRSAAPRRTTEIGIAYLR